MAIENYYITLVTQINQLVKVSITNDIMVSFMIYICIVIKAHMDEKKILSDKERRLQARISLDAASTNKSRCIDKWNDVVIDPRTGCKITEKDYIDKYIINKKGPE